MTLLKILKFRIVLIAVVFVMVLSSTRFAHTKSQILRSDGHYRDLPLTPAPIVMTTTLVGQSKDLFQKVNYQRKKKGKSPLLWDEKSAELASFYSKQMGEEGFFSHYDNEGNSIAERALKFKIKGWKKLGENLFKCSGYLEPLDVAVDAWLKSESHRINMLDDSWTHTGVGIHTTDERQTYMTQVFVKK